MVHWELAGTALRAVFLQPSRVDELEKIQVERAANRRQMNLIPVERAAYFYSVTCSAPAG